MACLRVSDISKLILEMALIPEVISIIYLVNSHHLQQCGIHHPADCLGSWLLQVAAAPSNIQIALNLAGNQVARNLYTVALYNADTGFINYLRVNIPGSELYKMKFTLP